MSMSARRWFFIGSFLLLVLVMFLLPAWSFPGYSISRNTTSHLGAQGSPHAWVMNLAFILAGLGSLLAVYGKLRELPFQILLIGIFSMSLMLTAVFRHAPLVEGVETNAFMDRQHSLFASLTGVSFVLFAVSVAFISRRPRDGRIAIAVGLIATALSLGMAALPEYQGIHQRAMFMIAFGWLIYVTRDEYELRENPFRKGR